jgi:hypothetical protein
MRAQEKQAFEKVLGYLGDPKKLGGKDGRLTGEDIHALSKSIAQTDPEVLGIIHQEIYSRAYQEAENHVPKLGFFDLFGVIEGVGRNIAYNKADKHVAQNYCQYQGMGIEEAVPTVSKRLVGEFENAGVKIDKTAGDDVARNISREEIKDFVASVDVIRHYFQRSRAGVAKKAHEHDLSGLGFPKGERSVEILKERLPNMASKIEELSSKASNHEGERISLAAVPANTNFRYATNGEIAKSGIPLEQVASLRREYNFYIDSKSNKLVRNKLDEDKWEALSPASYDYYGRNIPGGWKALDKDYPTLIQAERAELRSRWHGTEAKQEVPLKLDKQYERDGVKVEFFSGKEGELQGKKMYRTTNPDGTVVLGVEDSSASTGWRYANTKEKLLLKNYDDYSKWEKEYKTTEQVRAVNAEEISKFGLDRGSVAVNDFYLIQNEKGEAQKLVYYSKEDGTTAVSAIKDGKCTQEWKYADRGLSEEEKHAISLKQSEFLTSNFVEPLDLEDPKIKELLAGWSKGKAENGEETTYYRGQKGEIVLRYIKDGNTYVYTHSGKLKEDGSLDKEGFKVQKGDGGYLFNDKEPSLDQATAKNP